MLLSRSKKSVHWGSEYNRTFESESASCNSDSKVLLYIWRQCNYPLVAERITFLRHVLYRMFVIMFCIIWL